MGHIIVNAALRMRLGSGPQGVGVRKVRSLPFETRLAVVACLTVLISLSISSRSNAASADHKANASYASSNASQMSRAEEPVPANCIRQSCGKLWCWQMGGGKSSGR